MIHCSLKDYSETFNLMLKKENSEDRTHGCIQVKTNKMLEILIFLREIMEFDNEKKFKNNLISLLKNGYKKFLKIDGKDFKLFTKAPTFVDLHRFGG